MIELIVNPTAGNGRAKEIYKGVIEKLKERSIEHVLHLTDHPRHATEIAQAAAARGAKTVIVFGGDGTITETAAGLHGSKTALGIIPSGTGNDFIKTAGIPMKWDEALDFILSHPPRPIDTGTINDSFFINECGTGLDVMALDYANDAKKYCKGLLPYLYGVFRAILNFKPVDMHIEIDDLSMDGKFLVCAIGNGRYIGGGIPITPCADLTNGKFEILVVDAVPRWVIPFYLPALMMGTLYKKKRVAHQYQASRCLVRCKNMRLNLDGEIVPMEEALFLCKPASLLLHW